MYILEIILKRFTYFFLLIVLFFPISAFCQPIIYGGPAYYTYKWFDGEWDDQIGKEGDEYVFYIDTNRPGEITNNGSTVFYNDQKIDGPPEIDYNYYYDFFFVKYISGPNINIEYTSIEQQTTVYHVGMIDPFSEDVTQFRVSSINGDIGGFAHFRGFGFYCLHEYIGENSYRMGSFILINRTPAPVPEPSTILMLSFGILLPLRKFCHKILNKQS